MKNVYVDFVPSYEWHGLIEGEEGRIAYTKEGTLNRLVMSKVKEVLYKQDYVSIDLGFYVVRLELSKVRFLVVN